MVSNCVLVTRRVLCLGHAHDGPEQQRALAGVADHVVRADVADVTGDRAHVQVRLRPHAQQLLDHLLHARSLRARHHLLLVRPKPSKLVLK